MKKVKAFALVLVVLMMVQLISASGISVVSAVETNNLPLDIASGKQAVFTAKITRTGTENATIKLGSSDIFFISGKVMKILNSTAQGEYGAGEYTVRAYINPAQKMTTVEVTLPDGGVVRRGTYEITGDVISVNALNASIISNVGVTYEDISIANYTIIETEPEDSVFASSKARNLSMSFSDASHDRLFAWTATKKFAGSATLALNYREKGATEWMSVDAVKVVENTNVADEFFKAEIKGLKADTEYEYQIGKKGSTSSSHWSATYSFKTAPENTKNFSFIAIGDTQGYLWEHFKYTTAALDEAIKHVPNPAFILNTGDVVDSGYQAYQWDRYFRAMGTYASNIANFVAIGNHDTRNASNVQVNDDKNNYFSFYFNQPDAPEDALVMDPDIYAGLSASGKVQVDNFNETVFSYDYGNAHFIVLNSGTYVNTGNETYPDDEHIFEAQRAWLEKDLQANSDAKWTIILTHEAFYNRKGGKQDRTYLTDLIESYGVDLVITGHSHILTRTYPLKDGEIVTKESPDLIEKGIGTVYMTIGSTTPGHDTLVGSSIVENMYNVVSPDDTQPSYTTVSINNGKLTLTTRQLDGLIIDSFTIQGEDDPEPPTTEEETTTVPEETTETVTTTEPATEDPSAGAPETTEPTAEEPKKGCSGSVSVAGIALVAALGTCTVFVSKKKED